MSFLDQILPKSKNENYYVVLGVEQHHIIAIVVYMEGTSVEIKGFGESDFGKDGNEIEAADIAISTAEKSLPDDVLVQRAIFAVNCNYLTGATIKSEYRKKLNDITKELNLKPHGFITYPEALSAYFETQEGSPPTALFLAVENHQLICTLIRVGKLKQTEVVTRTQSIVADVTEILPKFKIDVLPSRIILYDHQEKLEEVKEELLRFPWHKHASFLHTPRIEILPPSALTRALVEAAGSSFLKEFTLEDNATQEKKELHVPAEKKLHEKAHEQQSSFDNLSIPEETFGFIIGTKEQHLHKPSSVHETIDKEHEKKERDQDKTGIASAFKLPSFIFPRISFPPVMKPFLALVIPVIGICIAGIALFSLVFYMHKATVALVVFPLTSTQQIDIVLSPKSADATGGKNMIPVTEIAEQATGTKTAATTGKTSVGENAKGEVTLYNKTLVTKTFPKGTVILHNDLEFTLDTEVTIASASDTGEGLAFGKNTIRATAASIGPDGNLSAGNTFVFKDFPENSFIAKNTQTFAGGTSREVPSVSKDDEEKLVSNLTQELVSNAKSKLVAKLSIGEKLIDVLVHPEITSKKLNPPVGTEAKETTLTLSIKMSGFTYKEEDLRSLTQKIIVSAPAGFTMTADQITVTIDEAKLDKNGLILAKGKIHAYFLPEIDTQAIANQLPGKTYDQVSAYVSSIPYIGGVKIFQEKSLPFIQNKLPLVKQNINIKIVPYLL